MLEELGISLVQGVLLDLGLSSDQLAWAHRGFSFASEGPLDMRFDADVDPASGSASAGPTAAELLSRLSANELAKIFFDYGEERFSRRIARRIVETRQQAPIETTRQLAELVRQSVPGRFRHGPIDPATRVFQALRIKVNEELDHLDATLKELPEILAPGGRAAVISFHSLEDRRVQVGLSQRPRADRPDQETCHCDGSGSSRQSPSAKRQTKGGRAMSEPGWNPTSAFHSDPQPAPGSEARKT